MPPTPSTTDTNGDLIQRADGAPLPRKTRLTLLNEIGIADKSLLARIKNVSDGFPLSALFLVGFLGPSHELVQFRTEIPKNARASLSPEVPHAI
jgi:hypothetical protein